ncbi:hypothetical protein ACET95_03650 [Aeromonas veronii]|uniref:hypothetical protein n=1 Tax=Aeromonas veronii TaxID=654 RepID=UPI0038D28CDE
MIQHALQGGRLAPSEVCANNAANCAVVMGWLTKNVVVTKLSSAGLWLHALLHFDVLLAASVLQSSSARRFQTDDKQVRAIPCCLCEFLFEPQGANVA